MAARWGVGSPARESGLGAAQGIIAVILPAIAFWVVVILLVVVL
jgi:hypothetical protein